MRRASRVRPVSACDRRDVLYSSESVAPCASIFDARKSRSIPHSRKLTGEVHMSAKVGRNERCPCGSGRKFKHCCGHFSQKQPTMNRVPSPQWIEQVWRRHQAAERLRQKQQGLGRPIISCELNGHRIIAVGRRVFLSKGWATFHAFLLDYLKDKFGSEWLARQAQNENHPIFDWFAATKMETIREIETPYRPVRVGNGNNATLSLMTLAYNLYLIEHHYEQYNQPLLERILERLKRATGFFAALAETYAAAAFLKSGFKIEYEDESAAG
jgi:hypothetical protein